MSEHCNLRYNQFSAVFQRLSWNSEHKVNSFNQSANVASVKKAGKKVTDSGQKHNMRVLHAKLENSSPEPVRKRIVIPRNVLKRPLINLIFLEIVIFYAQLVNKSHRKLRFVRRRRICIAHLRCVIDRVYRLITWFNHCFFTFSRVIGKTAYLWLQSFFKYSRDWLLHSTFNQPVINKRCPNKLKTSPALLKNLSYTS